MTKVINLLGGSGCGKTTVAAGLFYEMKRNGVSCEFVQEFVKTWVYQDKVIVHADQKTILEEQYKRESVLYGKVEYIITDSPFILSPIYEKFNYELNETEDGAIQLLKNAKEQGVSHINFLLNRTIPFDHYGRYEDEETAKKIDVAVKDFLVYNELDYYEITRFDQDAKICEIIQQL